MSRGRLRNWPVAAGSDTPFSVPSKRLIRTEVGAAERSTAEGQIATGIIRACQDSVDAGCPQKSRTIGSLTSEAGRLA